MTVWQSRQAVKKKLNRHQDVSRPTCFHKWVQFYILQPAVTTTGTVITITRKLGVAWTLPSLSLIRSHLKPPFTTLWIPSSKVPLNLNASLFLFTHKILKSELSFRTWFFQMICILNIPKMRSAKNTAGGDVQAVQKHWQDTVKEQIGCRSRRASPSELAARDPARTPHR